MSPRKTGLGVIEQNEIERAVELVEVDHHARKGIDLLALARSGEPESYFVSPDFHVIGWQWVGSRT